MESYNDSRVVRTIRSLRKIQATTDSISTRTSTPSQDVQLIEQISNREELASLKSLISPTELFELLKNDTNTLKKLQSEHELSPSTVRKIQDRATDFQEERKISEAKRIISAKIQERMDSLKRQIADSISNNKE
jgi:hypothetical protein